VRSFTGDERKLDLGVESTCNVMASTPTEVVFA
jgi:hypothetical protein